jgi:hypothetical protein
MMVAKVVVESAANADDAAAIELEQSIYDELDALNRTRPRLVTFAPKQALRRVLAAGDGGERPMRRAIQSTAIDMHGFLLTPSP